MFSIMLVCLGLLAVDEGAPSAANGRRRRRGAYEAAESQAGRDARAHVRLALWCESHGMSAERIKHLAMAVLYDPSNALARGLMGLVAFQGKWERPDEVSRQGPGRPRTRGADRGVFPAPGQDVRQGRRPVEAGRLVRAERAEGSGDRAVSRGVAAGPDSRGGLEAPGVQEGQRPVDQAGMAGGAEAGGEAAESSQQALEADAGEVARGGLQPRQGRDTPRLRRRWRV